MSQALYRQYRSQKFSEVVGQEHITDLLEQAITKDNFSHAYLFTGPRGVGKTSVARILAHEINKLPYSSDTHLDIIEIDAASNRRIDDIRDLREKVHIAPSSAAYKVYIIDEVHMLTSESFNALLKTLEEPPAHVIFILATTELHKVPATIASRAQRFQFRPVAISSVIEHLSFIAKKENITINQEALQLIAEHGEGSFRDSISLLDQLSSHTKDITASDVEQLLGLAPRSQLEMIIEAVANKNHSAAIAILDQLYKSGSSADHLTAQLLKLVPAHAIEHPELYNLLHELLLVPRSYSPSLQLLTTIARAAYKPKSKTAAHATTPEPSIVAEIKKKLVKPRLKAESVEPAIAAETESTISAEPIVGFNWPLIMEKLQKRNTALHSVLKRAETDYDETKLTLTFSYNLHRKKLEDSKYRSQLIATITDICGSCPEIVITLKDTSAPPADPIAASVAGIMGGGEQVNA